MLQELIYSEFFSQGDLEKAMGNMPVEMMDRDRAYIPSLQIEFIDHIAMPVYRSGHNENALSVKADNMRKAR